jgi:hypothetical protein
MSDIDRQSIINKLRALRAKTVEAGCTEGEAMAAAAKVEQLLAQYAVSRDELDQRSFQEAAYLRAEFKRDHRLKHKSLWLVLSQIASLTECKCWFPGSAGGSRGDTACFYGEEQDVEMALYLCGVIEKAIEGEWFIFSFANHDAHMPSFTDGCATRINERLRELRLHSEQFVRAAGKGLVVQAKAMVRERNLRGMGLNFTNSKMSPSQGRSSAAGYAAGDHVTFHQGVRNSGGAKSHPAMPLRLGHG